MIGSLRGQVLERWGDSTVLLDVGGVGYAVTVTPRTLAELEPTSSAFLYTFHHMREGDQALYGFRGRDEVTTFRTLLATHGVGPALAMAILATYPPPALVDVVAANDAGALKAIAGVGPKTAQRLLVELRDRLALPVVDVAGSGGAGGSAGATASALAAVREALAGLGYSAEEIRDVVRELDVAADPQRAGGPDTPTLLRDALKLLGTKRA